MVHMPWKLTQPNDIYLTYMYKEDSEIEQPTMVDIP